MARTIVKKSDKGFLTLISKDFKKVKSGNSVVTTLNFHFPLSFVKTAKSGESKFINLKATNLANFAFVTPDAKKPTGKKK